MRIELDSIAEEMGLDYVPPVNIVRKTRGGSVAEFVYSKAAWKGSRGLIAMLSPDARPSYWRWTRAHVAELGRYDGPYDRNFLRWVVAHECGHAWYLRNDPDYRERVRADQKAIALGIAEYHELVTEREADELANRFWKHVKINGHTARGA